MAIDYERAVVSPPIVRLLAETCGAWVVGSAAKYLLGVTNGKPRDWDLMVPLSGWALASRSVPADAKPNSFGGFKCNFGSDVCDIWPGELGQYLAACSEEVAFAVYLPGWVYLERRSGFTRGNVADQASELTTLRADLAAATERERVKNVEVARLREALEPFADYAVWLDDHDASLRIGYYRPSPTVGDCRNAAAALAAPSAPAGPDLAGEVARLREALGRAIGIIDMECDDLELVAELRAALATPAPESWAEEREEVVERLNRLISSGSTTCALPVTKGEGV